jgi:lysophospholipase L1-like esterase
VYDARVNSGTNRDFRPSHIAEENLAMNRSTQLLVYFGQAVKRMCSAMNPKNRTFPIATIAVLGFVAAGLMSAPVTVARSNDSDQKWIATWGASPVAPLAANTTNPGFTNQTVRLIAHTSIGGKEVRIRLSNAFGTEPLIIGSAHIALGSTKADIVAGTDRTLTFGGSATVTIPPGALVISDEVKLDTPALSNLAVSIYLPGPTGQATWHPAAIATSYVSTAGNFAAEAQMPIDHTVTSWFYLTGVEVKAPKGTLAIVTLGDSITDGTRSTTDTNHRWPNLLAERLVARHAKLTVVDEGIAGNRVLNDLTGPNALARFDRDVVAQPGAAYVTVMLGINDIGRSSAGQPISADEIIAGQQQIITRAHEQGLKIVGCTLTPYEGAAYFSQEGEVKRQAVNKFIRSSGAYDGVIDFDAAVRDPNQTSKIQAAFDSGDHLHPNDAGYQAMANAVDLTLFKKR